MMLILKLIKIKNKNENINKNIKQRLIKTKNIKIRNTLENRNVFYNKIITKNFNFEIVDSFLKSIENILRKKKISDTKKQHKIEKLVFKYNSYKNYCKFRLNPHFNNLIFRILNVSEKDLKEHCHIVIAALNVVNTRKNNLGIWNYFNYQDILSYILHIFINSVGSKVNQNQEMIFENKTFLKVTFVSKLSSNFINSYDFIFKIKYFFYFWKNHNFMDSVRVLNSYIKSLSGLGIPNFNFSNIIQENIFKVESWLEKNISNINSWDGFLSFFKKNLLYDKSILANLGIEPTSKFNRFLKNNHKVEFILKDFFKSFKNYYNVKEFKEFRNPKAKYSFQSLMTNEVTFFFNLVITDMLSNGSIFKLIVKPNEKNTTQEVPYISLNKDPEFNLMPIKDQFSRIFMICKPNDWKLNDLGEICGGGFFANKFNKKSDRLLKRSQQGRNGCVFNESRLKVMNEYQSTGFFINNLFLLLFQIFRRDYYEKNLTEINFSIKKLNKNLNNFFKKVKDIPFNPSYFSGEWVRDPFDYIVQEDHFYKKSLLKLHKDFYFMSFQRKLNLELSQFNNFYPSYLFHSNDQKRIITKEEYHNRHSSIIKKLKEKRVDFFGSLSNYESFYSQYKSLEQDKKKIQRCFSKHYLYYYNVNLAKLISRYKNKIFYVQQQDFRGRIYSVTNTFSSTSGVLKNFLEFSEPVKIQEKDLNLLKKYLQYLILSFFDKKKISSLKGLIYDQASVIFENCEVLQQLLKYITLHFKDSFDLYKEQKILNLHSFLCKIYPKGSFLEERYLFYFHLLEYFKIVHLGIKESSVIYYTDAVNSGLAIIVGSTKSAFLTEWEKTNLLSSEGYNDIYISYLNYLSNIIIGDESVDQINKIIIQGLGRSSVKLCVMPYSYGITAAGIFEKMLDSFWEDSNLKTLILSHCKEIGYISDHFYHVLNLDEFSFRNYFAIKYLAVTCAKIFFKYLGEYLPSIKKYITEFSQPFAMLGAEYRLKANFNHQGVSFWYTYDDKTRIIHSWRDKNYNFLNYTTWKINQNGTYSSKFVISFGANATHNQDYLLLSSILESKQGFPLVTIHDAFGSHLSNILTVDQIFKECFWNLFLKKKSNDYYLNYFFKLNLLDLETYFSNNKIVNNFSSYLNKSKGKLIIKESDFLSLIDGSFIKEIERNNPKLEEKKRDFINRYLECLSSMYELIKNIYFKNLPDFITKEIFLQSKFLTKFDD